MVLANLGIGFIPEQAAKKAAADGSISILKPKENPPKRTISLLKRKDMPLSIAAVELERMLLHRKQEKDGAL
ncbi:MAG: LysR family transcriptional regulator, partial [Lachnospiraceae bacterium]|nr:LysR family transcriptional regulator [Lachnospiraceae bacterium]